MKKNKLLIPILTSSALTAIATPLVFITSCGNSKYNLMKEFTPSIKPATFDVGFASVNAVIDSYLDAINDNHKIFEQDVLYTLSRGLPQYEAYISEHCEVKEFKFGADVDLVSVDKTNRKVTFDISLNIKFDLTGTKKEELAWYETTIVKQDSKTKLRFVFDFGDTGFDQHALALRRKMTTFAGATQFGISEIGSTVKLLSETGKITDINGTKVELNAKEEQNSHPFILPDEKYWTKSEYLKRYSDVSEVWYNDASAQMVVLIFKYYMSNNIWPDIKAPSTLNFGSYYMQNATLNSLYTYYGDSDPVTIYGFNCSLDSINNAKNLNSSSDFKNGNLTLPTKIGEHYVDTVNGGAFNGSASTYTNLGLPENVTGLTIPGGDGLSYVYKIGSEAFSTNYWLKTITFGCPTQQKTQATNFPHLSSNAFYNMSAVETIDFSAYPADIASTLEIGNNFENCFYQLRLGRRADAEGKYGTIYIPAESAPHRDEWKSFIESTGLAVWESGSEGWELVPKS